VSTDFTTRAESLRVTLGKTARILCNLNALCKQFSALGITVNQSHHIFVTYFSRRYCFALLCLILPVKLRISGMLPGWHAGLAWFGAQG
jgi:hypothetical protein